jgi:RimJ/RimL family protein N-acetyltransferase
MDLRLQKSTIRSFRRNDVDSLATHINSARVAHNMNLIPHPYTREMGVDWIEKANAGTPETHFAITIADAVVGGIGLELLDPARQNVSQHVGELGYWLGEQFWGRGIMSEAVAAFTEWSFSNLEIIRVQAAVYARNPASARVPTKANFVFEGRQRARYLKDNELIDGLIFARIRHE